MIHATDTRVVEYLKHEYPPGTEVELQYTLDPDVHVQPGTRGTVIGVDDLGIVHVEWETGHKLGLVFSEDRFVKVEKRFALIAINENYIIGAQYGIGEPDNRVWRHVDGQVIIWKGAYETEADLTKKLLELATIYGLSPSALHIYRVVS